MELKSETKEASETVDTIEVEQEFMRHSGWLERPSFRITLISIFTALAIVLGYLLHQFINIELFTLTIFLSGFILGKRDGMIVGFFSSFIFCFFNPLSPSPFPLLIFQLVHYTLTGLIGALLSGFLSKKGILNKDKDLYQFSLMAIFGCIGALITTSFQIFASLVYTLSFYNSFSQFITHFLTGAVFTAIHIIGNTLGFIFILPGLIQLINKMLY
ncbi:MAG: ECF transporter S component [Promethearchaeota archaeon]|nr:MAG: ECF transporter S component [Candidatus Lokiarchaeota archaeon]